MEPVQVIGLVASILRIAAEIVALVDGAMRNREKCNLLGTRVEMIRDLMKDLQNEGWALSPATRNLLLHLEVALCEGRDLVESCKKRRTFSHVFKSQKKANKIGAVDVRITMILQQFQIANMILIVSIKKESRLFNLIEKLLQDGAGRRLSRKVLQSSIEGLSNTDNMSPDAKRVLELLIREQNQGGVGGTTSSVQQPEAPTNVDELTTDILSAVTYIVEEAPKVKHNRDEILKMARIVQRVGELVTLPELSEMPCNPNTRPTMNCLKHDLQQAFTIILYNRPQNASRISRVILCGVDGGGNTWQQPEVIRQVACRIEYYVTVLPLEAMRQINATARHA
ncbi:hypothetical protein QOZ80_9BG0715970 [Eleusine coracana subsp. coracana]|nr:hypothetical protein QOZ80_9BG0715970 [Eleusine coracana subsp. coracana]